MKLLSIIIPVYNEEQSIKPLFTQIKRVFDTKLRDYKFEVIFVNDGSSDNSLNQIQNLMKTSSKIRVINFPKNLGKTNALKSGFESSRGQIIITLDGDGQDGPENIPAIIKKMSLGFDLVIGWKKKRFDPLSKIIPAKIFNYILSNYSGLDLHDFNSGFKVIDATVARHIPLSKEGMHRFIPLLVHSQGFKVTEIPVTHHKRKFGRSKYGLFRYLNGISIFITIIRERQSSLQKSSSKALTS